MVPEDRARLKGFRDREADCGASFVTRMFTEGTRAPALCGAVRPQWKQTLSTEYRTSGLEAYLGGSQEVFS